MKINQFYKVFMCCCVMLLFLGQSISANNNEIPSNSEDDLTEITLSCPSNITLNASGPNGAVAYWNTPSANTQCVIQGNPDCSSVPNNYSGYIFMGEHNGSKYYCSSSSNHSWNAGNNMAQNIGGHLVVINNYSENNFLKITS